MFQPPEVFHFFVHDIKKNKAKAKTTDIIQTQLMEVKRKQMLETRTEVINHAIFFLDNILPVQQKAEDKRLQTPLWFGLTLPAAE